MEKTDVTWVIKVGQFSDGDPPEYLHDFGSMKFDGSFREDDVKWTDKQSLAHRFYERNQVSRIANKMPICAYGEDVRIVRLKPKPPVLPSSEDKKE